MIPLTEEEARVLAWAARRPDKRSGVLNQLAEMRAALIRHDEHMAAQARWLEQGRATRAALQSNIQTYEAALAGGIEA